MIYLQGYIYSFSLNKAIEKDVDRKLFSTLALKKWSDSQTILYDLSHFKRANFCRPNSKQKNLVNYRIIKIISIRISYKITLFKDLK